MELNCCVFHVVSVYCVLLVCAGWLQAPLITTQAECRLLCFHHRSSQLKMLWVTFPTLYVRTVLSCPSRILFMPQLRSILQDCVNFLVLLVGHARAITAAGSAVFEMRSAFVFLCQLSDSAALQSSSTTWLRTALPSSLRITHQRPSPSSSPGLIRLPSSVVLLGLSYYCFALLCRCQLVVTLEHSQRYPCMCAFFQLNG